MNLLMVAPLRDSKGSIRYFLGAQVDVSGLVKDCVDLPSLERLVEEQTTKEQGQQQRQLQQQYNQEYSDSSEDNDKDEFKELSEMFNAPELDTVRKFGGRMHREHAEEFENDGMPSKEGRVLLRESSPDVGASRYARAAGLTGSGYLSGVYQNVSSLSKPESASSPFRTASFLRPCS